MLMRHIVATALALLVATPGAARAKGVLVRVMVPRGFKGAKRIERMVRTARHRLEWCRARYLRWMKRNAQVLIAVHTDAPGKQPRVTLNSARGAPSSLGRCLLAALRKLAPRLHGPRFLPVVLTVLKEPRPSAVRANPRTRMYHYRGCPGYRCRRCKRFDSPVAAVRAGYRPHRACIPPGALVPAMPRGSGPRECRRNAQCTFTPHGPCYCRPCSIDWRGVTTTREAQRMQNQINAMGACSRRCPHCARRGVLLGSRAVCYHGHCEVRP